MTGLWQVYTFHAKRLAAKGGVFLDEKTEHDRGALAATISLLEQHLGYIKLALAATALPSTISAEITKASLTVPEHSIDGGNATEAPAEDASATDGASSHAGMPWAERSMARFDGRSMSRESVLSRSGKSSLGSLGVSGANNVFAPPLHTIAKLARNPRTQKTGSALSSPPLLACATCRVCVCTRFPGGFCADVARRCPTGHGCCGTW